MSAPLSDLNSSEDPKQVLQKISQMTLHLQELSDQLQGLGLQDFSQLQDMLQQMRNLSREELQDLGLEDNLQLLEKLAQQLKDLEMEDFSQLTDTIKKGQETMQDRQEMLWVCDYLS